MTLLRGKSNITETCEAVVDVLQEDLPSIPDVFHEVVFNFLNSKATHIRVNGSKLLGTLVLAFSDLLEKLISESSSDGKLFDLSDINIMKIVSNEDAFLLCRTDADDTNNMNESVYSKNWLEAQREELKSRIGLETNTSVDSYANKYDEVNMYISSEDIKIVNSIQSDGNINEKSTEELPVALNTSHIDATTETWLTRLLRCMIVGLLNPNWEVRHGYSLGLTQILGGLYPQLISPTHFHQVTRALPEFICDDIMCCAVCVLLLDRLLDFGDTEDTSSISPVKETAGELLICALRCHCSPAQRQLLWNHIQTMLALTNHHWTVSLGGYIALKHFIGLNIDMILDSSSCYSDLIEMVSTGLAPDQTEDVHIAAYSCIDAMGFAMCTANTHTSSLLVDIDVVQVIQGLGDIISSMRMVSLEVPGGGACSSPALARSRSTALHSLCGILRYIVTLPAAVAVEKECVMEVCGELLELLGHLQRGLFRFELSVRECCRRDLIGTLQQLSPVLQGCTATTKPKKSTTDTTQRIRHEVSSKNTAESIVPSTSTVCERLFALFGSLLSCNMVSAKNPVLDLRLAEIESGKKSKSGRGTTTAAARRKLGAEVNEVDVSEGVEIVHISTQEGVSPLEEAMGVEENRASLAQLVQAWCVCTVAVLGQVCPPGCSGELLADLLRSVFCSALSLSSTASSSDPVNTLRSTNSAGTGDNQGISEQLTSSFYTAFRSTLDMYLQSEGLFAAKENVNIWLVVHSSQRENLSIALAAAVEYLITSKCVPETVIVSLISALYEELHTQTMQIKEDSVLQEKPASAQSLSSSVAPTAVAQHASVSVPVPVVKKRKFQFIIVPDKPSVARLPITSCSVVQTVEEGGSAEGRKERKNCEDVEKLYECVQWLCGMAFLYLSLKIQQSSRLGGHCTGEISAQEQILAVLHSVYTRLLRLSGPSSTTTSLQRLEKLLNSNPTAALQQLECASTEHIQTTPTISTSTSMAVVIDTSLAHATAAALLLQQEQQQGSEKRAPWQSALTGR